MDANEEFAALKQRAKDMIRKTIEFEEPEKCFARRFGRSGQKPSINFLAQWEQATTWRDLFTVLAECVGSVVCYGPKNRMELPQEYRLLLNDIKRAAKQGRRPSYPSGAVETWLSHAPSFYLKDDIDDDFGRHLGPSII